MKARLAPFLALLDARYAPLLFAVAPQSFAVYLWLWRGSDQSGAAFWFAVIGAIGYEFIYVGAIAWAENGQRTRWTWVTAFVALVFSVAVAVYVYIGQGWWAALHAGFPVVAFCYTITMHLSAAAGAEARTYLAQRRRLVVRLVRMVRNVRADLHTQDTVIAHLRVELAHATEGLTQVRTQAAHHEADVAQRDQRLAHLRTDLMHAHQEIAQREQEIAQREQEAAHLNHTLTQVRADAAQAHDLAAQRDQEAARLRQQLAQQATQLADLAHTPPHVGDLDFAALAQRLKDGGTSWRDIEALLHTPQSTLRNWLKVRTNGHLADVPS